MLVELDAVGYTYLANSAVADNALNGVSMAVDEGEFIAVIGATGSGKTTLAQVMAGLLRPDAGRVLYEGADIWRDRKQLPQRRRLAGLVFQEPERQLFEMTVEDDIGFWPRNVGVAAAEMPGMVEKAMTAVGLDYEAFRGRSPFGLSGGEMRRAAIAGILVMAPPLLILDEPTVALDPVGRAGLLERMKKLNREGTAIMLVSHDMDEVAELADRVIVMDKGRIVVEGAPRSIFSQGELLAKLGLELPQMARLAKLLADKGLALRSLPLTLGEMEDEILSALGESPA